MKIVTSAQRQQAINRLLSSRQGRQRIAATVQGPLRKLRDYVSIARRAYMIDDLPDGALPIYDMDPNIGGYVVSEAGDSILSVFDSTRLMVPLYELAALPTVPITQVKERRFDVINRIKQKARAQMFRTEDRVIFAAIVAAATANTPLAVATAEFSMDTMADAFAGVEQHGLRVDKIFFNPNQIPVIRTAGRDFLDFETQRELLQTGFLGTLWGAQVHISMEVPAGTVLIVAEPEYFGVMPIRIDLTVIPADDPRKREFGWSLFANQGTAIHNPQGVQAINIS
jgi:hypothetical protein